MAGGWLAAVGLLAGLFERAKTGQGQQVATSLLGAGMLLHSGVFLRDGEVVRGPQLAADQTGHGPGYRIWQAADEQWFALVVPDEPAWRHLEALTDTELGAYAPLLHGPAEAALEAAFRTAPAQEWIARLREAALPVEPVAILTRDGFRRGILDDPDNRATGRVVEYETRDWGHFEQLGPLLHCALEQHGRPRDPQAGPALLIPGVGEHSVEVLTELGFTSDEIDILLRRKAVRQQ
jgi:crotonobetainyl-CoA:carnitine CoA-transferase CaiB-like acyl-CoA transferase